MSARTRTSGGAGLRAPAASLRRLRPSAPPAARRQPPCGRLLQLFEQQQRVVVVGHQFVERGRRRGPGVHHVLDLRFDFVRVLAEAHRAGHARAALDRVQRAQQALRRRRRRAGSAATGAGRCRFPAAGRSLLRGRPAAGRRRARRRTMPSADARRPARWSASSSAPAPGMRLRADFRRSQLRLGLRDQFQRQFVVLALVVAAGSGGAAGGAACVSSGASKPSSSKAASNMSSASISALDARVCRRRAASQSARTGGGSSSSSSVAANSASRRAGEFGVAVPRRLGQLLAQGVQARHQVGLRRRQFALREALQHLARAVERFVEQVALGVVQRRRRRRQRLQHHFQRMRQFAQRA